jgi:class 3 adenylate cyclase
VTTEALAEARRAYDRHAWDEALAALTQVDLDGGLEPADLQLLADTATWVGQPDLAMDALERAFAGHERAGDRTSAALVALRLADKAFERNAYAVLQGWLARADRLLADEPPSSAHGSLAAMRSIEAALIHHDLDAAFEHIDRAIEIGQGFGDVDLQYLGQSYKGQLLIKTGRWAEGLALIDEAAATASSGELTPKTACDVYCLTISACRDLADYRRAGEWTDQAQRWMRRQSIDSYVGICRVHRAELKRVRGSWEEAEQEARDACEELERHRLLFALGLAHYEVGEVRLHMGDLEAADEAFRRAYEYGWDPQPGHALLLLARGDTDAAATSIARSLASGADDEADTPSRSALDRGRLLPAQVEIALARDDLDTARTAIVELEAIAAHQASGVWEATALTARGALLLHEGDADRAVKHLDKAWRAWQSADVPYEAARARMRLGQAHALAGDTAAWRLELQAAGSVFERLGAAPDLAQVEALLRAHPSGADRRHRVTKTFMFTDIVTSTDLVTLIGDQAWERLLAWHDQLLRGCFARFGGQEVRHTGDGFFAAFEGAEAAIECAIDIQRRLDVQRRDHGFAPSVRIGVHAAEVTEDGSDYRGKGVHAAARIGELAGRDEILVSADTIEQPGKVGTAVSTGRQVALRGIDEPVVVHTVDWSQPA